jgi:hypothetical protein
MVGEVANAQSSDTDTDLPIVLTDLLTNFKSDTILRGSKLADFEAIQLLHRLKFVCSIGICCFIAQKW